MAIHESPRAFFPLPDGSIYPDMLICSGQLPAELDGKPCPFSDCGRTPHPIPLDANNPNYSIDKGQEGDLFPPCAKYQLSSLGHWQGYKCQYFPSELLMLKLFKCKMGFWFVVPGLEDKEA